MTPTEVILSIISVVGTMSSILFAYLAFRRSDRGDHKQEGKNEGVLMSDVGYIKSSIDRIEKTMEKLDEGYDALKERVAKIEIALNDHIGNKDIHQMGGKGEMKQ